LLRKAILLQQTKDVSLIRHLLFGGAHPYLGNQINSQHAVDAFLKREYAKDAHNEIAALFVEHAEEKMTHPLEVDYYKGIADTNVVIAMEFCFAINKSMKKYLAKPLRGHPNDAIKLQAEARKAILRQEPEVLVRVAKGMAGNPFSRLSNSVNKSLEAYQEKLAARPANPATKLDIASVTGSLETAALMLQLVASGGREMVWKQQCDELKGELVLTQKELVVTQQTLAVTQQTLAVTQQTLAVRDEDVAIRDGVIANLKEEFVKVRSKAEIAETEATEARALAASANARIDGLAQQLRLLQSQGTSSPVADYYKKYREEKSGGNESIRRSRTSTAYSSEDHFSGSSDEGSTNSDDRNDKNGKGKEQRFK